MSAKKTKVQLAPTAGKTTPKVTTGTLAVTQATPTYPVDGATGEPLNQGPRFLQPARFLKGALISYDPDTQKTISRVVFQYNPKELSRSLKPDIKQGKQGKDLLRPPSQTISTTVQLQAIDRMIAQTKKKQTEKSGLGLYAQLAALELLLYPKSTVIKAYRDDLAKGTKGAVPASAFPVLFQWGPRRLLPVRVTSMEVKETLFNVALSPIAAEVTLSMEVEDIVRAKGMAYTLLYQNLTDLEGTSDADTSSVKWRQRGGY